MRPLNEILQSLKEKYGYTEQEIIDLSYMLDQIAELSYITFKNRKRLSENNHCDK